MKIWKFGGTSVASPKNIQKIADILSAETEAPRAIICSAFGGVTDQLITLMQEATKGGNLYVESLEKIRERHIEALRELASDADLSEAHQQVGIFFDKLTDLARGISLTQDVTTQTKDHVLSFGERLSNLIITYALRNRGIEVEYLDARKIIFTDSNYGNARVNREKSYPEIGHYFQEHSKLQCVTGFIGSCPSGKTTTLGRGGSDYTASLIAAALKADLLEIWTDVDGVLTADPRVVPEAHLVPELTYTEAMELSHFGAKVLYPPTIQPVRQFGIPLVVRNTFNPNCPGSKITADAVTTSSPITAISSMSTMAVLTLSGSGLVGVPGSSERLFSSLARRGVNVILISQASSERSICFAVNANQADLAEQAVNTEFELEQQTKRVDPVAVERDCAIISVVGEGMKHLPGVAGTVFSALGRNRINIIAIAQGSSEENISLVVKAKDEPHALQTIHRNFFERVQLGSIVLLGAGQVGREFLSQVEKQLQFVREKYHFDLRLVGVVRSKQLLLDPSGISWTNWQEDWNEAATDFGGVSSLIQQLLDLKTPNLVVVDCTASGDFTNLYNELLSHNIAVVGANKKVQTGSFSDFQTLREISSRKRTPWKFETSVGAALPIISSLESLVATGDQVQRIEAILSGSLSYTFNKLQTGATFSEVIREASEKGYLEPDPRDDLDGTDFARKLLILSRLIGLEFELKDILVEPLLPDQVMRADSVDEFMKRLPSLDEGFRERVTSATRQNKRLRYCGVIECRAESPKASISLREVDPSNAFYGLAGSDNLISFFTARYPDQPLVIRGSGAGPAVTASGVFWDLIQALVVGRELT
ncbi:MAG: bifunctional aspartate kinase/homoserine dehydrogenase I [Bdellovibrionales bacterium]|nr:bifunctional aspartate kinase/homoserine dehydrogenase I [Bdellovibrionales bacterium]